MLDVGVANLYDCRKLTVGEVFQILDILKSCKYSPVVCLSVSLNHAYVLKSYSGQGKI